MKKPVIILAALCLVAGLTVGLCAALGVFGGVVARIIFAFI